MEPSHQPEATYPKPDPTKIGMRSDITLALTPDNVAGLNTSLKLKIDLFVLVGSLTSYQLEEAFTPYEDDPSLSEGHELLTQGVHFIAGLGLDSRATEIITQGSQLGKKIAYVRCHGGTANGEWTLADNPSSPRTVITMSDLLTEILYAGNYFCIIVQACNPDNCEPEACEIPIFYTLGITQPDLTSEQDAVRAFMPAIPSGF